jgi:hypothetical protein
MMTAPSGQQGNELNELITDRTLEDHNAAR